MGDPNGILVTVEGWGVNLAGCYGNALLPTPSIDRLAAHGIVMDQFWMHSVHLEPNLHAILQGIHPSCWIVSTDSPQAASLFRLNEDLDRLEVAHGPEHESFDHLITESLECWLQQRHQRPFLWIHSRGLRGPWDAPYEYRKLMCDSEDPDPPSDTDAPDTILHDGWDPDLLFGLACGAGAQSVCIDQGIGLIQQTLTELGIHEDCWIAVAGLQAFPLGEHRRVGLGHRALRSPGCVSLGDAYSERLHAPWIIRPAPAMKLGARVDHLVQPSHLGAWLESMVEDGLSDSIEKRLTGSPMVWALGVDEIAVITQRWSARFDTTRCEDGSQEIAEDSIGQVYCFPEDRWQQNEIANRVPQVQSLLRELASSLLSPSEDNPTSSEQVAKWLTELHSIQR